MKNFNLLIFRPTFKPLSQKKWPLSVNKNLLALSWFVITRSTVLKIFFPFISMHHGRTLNNRIFRLHEKFLITYNEEHSSFRCFFNREGSVSIQTRDLQILATEIFKDSKGTAWNVFPNILIIIYLKISVHVNQSNFQLNPGKIVI